MKISIRKKLFVFSFIILSGNCILGYAIYKSNQKLLESERWVHHTEQVIYQSALIFSTAKDIKTTSRDFIITNDSAFIKSLYLASNSVFSNIRELKRLTLDNPSQQERIDSLDLYMHKRFNFSLQAIEVRKKHGFKQAITYVAAQNDKYYSVPIKQIIDAIQQEEESLLKNRRAVSEHTVKDLDGLSLFVFALMAGCTILLLIALGKYLLQIDEKEKRAAELVIANEELLFQNNEKGKRAGELVVANKELLFQNKEKEKRADELVIANKELLFQNEEKEKRAAELVIANKELLFQNDEKEKRAVELAIANLELSFQNEERRIAEKNLSKSEARLKEAQAISHIGNFDIDLINDTDLWSDGMYKIYGIHKETVIPSTTLFLSFIYPPDLDYVTARVNEAYKTYKSFAINFRFIHENGGLRYGYLEAKFKLSKEHTPLRLFGILQDVTDLKLAELERTKMVNDLMLRNNDLEQFAYIISHNLRAPIANIIGASSVLNDVNLSINDKKLLNQAINISVVKLDNVVQDLNHILQVKSSVNENKEVVSFSGLVDDIKISISNLLNKYDIKIAYDFSEIDEFLTIKPYLYSVFFNLISNSVKYRKQDVSTIIKIESHNISNSLQLIFTDNGMGIDLKKKGDEVFGLYKRFHTDIEGKGMGLYMVKTQVETLGGKISIKSAKNKGAEFVIEFAV